ncbi:DUF5788 family protein [Methanolobus sp. ZRKC3]|uniref:DUF5788 family protein n=1 Tax=Methanolobus sp. ZRKC3 TaxID=3125786 RepID=UPI00324F29F6
MQDSCDNDLISERDRNKLLKALKARLFWVGVQVPYSVDVNGNQCKLHEMVWELINKEHLSEEDSDSIETCILHLKEKEKDDELKLSTDKLTKEEAKKLFYETSGILRAIMDLRSIENGTSREKREDFHKACSIERVENARKWVQFLKTTGEA